MTVNDRQDSEEENANCQSKDLSRRRFAKIASVTGVTGIAGCLGSSSQGDDSDTILVGGTLGLTGHHSGTTPIYQAGYRTVVKWINDAGGIEVNGEKKEIKLKIYDDENNKQRVKNLYNRLVEKDNADFLLGPYSSSINYTAAGTIEKLGVPAITAGAASPAVFNEVANKWLYSVLSTVDKYNLGIIDTMAQVSPSPNLVGGIRENNQVNQISAQATKEYAKKKGVTFKIIDTYDVETNDLTSSIAKAKSQGTDFLMNLGHLPNDALMVNQAYDLSDNWKGFAVGTAIGTSEFPEQVGTDKARGIIGPQLWSPKINVSNIDKFRSDFKREYKEIAGEKMEPDYHAGLAGVSIQVIRDTIQTASSLDPDALRKTLTSKTYSQTLNGEFSFGDNNVYTPQRSYGVQLQGEDELGLELVAPKEVASAKPIWPMTQFEG